MANPSWRQASTCLLAIAAIFWASAPVSAQSAPPPVKSRFISDVAGDYRAFVSWDSLQWLAIGGVGALAIAEADEALRQQTEDPNAPLTRALDAGEAGAHYGNLTMQVPLAIGWWAVAHATGHQRGAEAGRDLLRAQISALSWTYAFKYAVNRTRPNGDPRSFPSGHSSATFATAMVLQEHYGWKVGLPVFAAATYTAGSRMTVNKHWASDVAFGAVLGMVSARTVTLHLREAPLRISPMVLDGGGGVLISIASRSSRTASRRTAP